MASWQTPVANTDTNLYNTNGTISDNRTVAQGDKTLSFTGTKTNAFSVDGSIFSVDAANDRVGIGTVSPNNVLDLGTSEGTNATDEKEKKLVIYNKADGSSFYGLGVNGNILQFHAGSKSDAPEMVLHSTGKVGIGTTDPTHKLHVEGGNVKIVDGTQGANKVLTSDAIFKCGKKI